MIGIALVGAGHWGPNLLRNFHNKQSSSVLWAIDQDPDRLKLVSSKYPEISLGSDLSEAIEDSRVDAVVIATPTSTHYPIAKAALSAGRHVLVEKPISSTSTQAEELCEIALSRGVVLMVGHVFIFNPGVRKVREYLTNDLLGRIHYISMVRTNLGPIRVDVNAAWDLASHDISIVNHWLGTGPLTASAIGGSWINPGVDDVVFASLRFPDEILVNLHVSWLNPRKARDITVVGERKMLTFDDMNLTEPLRIYDKQVTDELIDPGLVDTFGLFRASIREGDVTIPKVPIGEPLMLECSHFLECIDSATPPLTGGPEGLAVVKVLEAIQRSIENDGLEEKV
ncbi:MAG TPA: Gfo/Idh/MocA family oxidoreductase [Actinomycetota bacterium]|nr:Gfo/Idh/MocA family oxidoreductase [Actinomycetota bacterium]